MRTLRTARDALADVERKLVAVMPPHVRGMRYRPVITMLEVLSRAIRSPDRRLALDFATGFQVRGKLPPCGWWKPLHGEEAARAEPEISAAQWAALDHEEWNARLARSIAREAGNAEKAAEVAELRALITSPPSVRPPPPAIMPTQ